VTDPEDRRRILESIKEHRSDFLTLIPALRKLGAAPERPAAERPRTTRRPTMNLKTFLKNPSPDALPLVLPGLRTDVEERQLVKCLLEAIEDASLPRETRAAFSENVAQGMQYLKKASNMDRVRLVRHATDKAKQKLVDLEGNTFVRDMLELGETEADLFQAALDVFLLAKSANLSASENSLESLLSDGRVSGGSFDRLLEIYLTKLPVSAPALEKIAAARRIQGGGLSLLLDGYIRKEQEPWRRVFRMANAMKPGRAVVRPRPPDRTGEDGADDALLSALLKELRELGPKLPGPRKAYLGFEDLISYVVRPSVSGKMQAKLAETYKSLPKSLTYMRWDIFRSIAAIADRGAVTFLIKNLPKQAADMAAAGDKDTVAEDPIVSLKLQELTGVPIQGDWITEMQEWWKSNRRLLRNQIPQ
jgi:hypothetical protein